MAMKRLSLDLQCILSSSLQINNFKRVVEELVYNALDAKATSIAVRVDLKQNKIQVVDNGCGITENDFDLLGQKYSTSKCVDLNTLKSVPNTYGYRGQFLANLVNIAQKVKITSRFEKGGDTWVKIFYNGKQRDLAKTTTRPSVGTTVEVNGLFYNLHIQSKKVESLHELNEIKTLLKQLSLVYSGISISLRDDSKNEIVFKAHKNRNIYQTFGLLFNIDEKDIQEFKVEKKEYRVTAYFGKKDEDITQHHWIFLNGKFINNSKLHKIVNENLGKYFKYHTKRKIKTKVNEDEDIISKGNIPFYIILLSCPYYDYDLYDSSKHTTLEFKNWQDITNLLKKLIMFYTGDETLNKQLKHEITTKTSLKPKVPEDDTRDQIRKIVEKLLKSNSKKLGITQIQNGVKGKLTKRKKKNNSLKLSLSKVIPSKNKIIRQSSKDKKIKLSDKILSGSNPSEVIAFEDEQKKYEKQIEEQHIPDNKKKAKYSTKVKEKSKRKSKQEDFKKSIEKENLDASIQRLDLSVNLKQDYIKRNKNIFQDNYVGANIYTHNHKRKKYTKQDNLENSFENVKLTKTKNIQQKYSNAIRNNYTEEHSYNQRYKKDQVITENDITTICNFTDSNKNITLREKIEQIIIYDYVPHPLNSTECCDLNQNKLKKESYLSSRDLVQTILNTQYKNCSTENNISLSHDNMSKLQQRQLSENIKEIFASSPKRQRNKIKNITKNTRDTTFDAWKLNFDLDSPNHEQMVVSKMTYESHNYNNNIAMQDDKVHKTLVRKTKQFITKQSKENFLISMGKEKKNLHRNKLICKPHVNKHDINSIGLKNFFKNKNFLQESSFMIEFSNSTSNNIPHKTNYFNETTENIFIFSNNSNRMKSSNLDEELIYESSVNSHHKNTYIINENTLETRYNFNECGQNYEYTGYASNVLQSTYTIEKNSETYLYNWTNTSNFSQNYDKNYTMNDKDGLNIVFISNPQMEVIETSSDKIIEPINICETILGDNASNDRLRYSLANIGNDVNQLPDDIDKLCTNRQELRNESLRESLQEISHHFNNTGIGDPTFKAVTNKSQMTNTDHTKVNKENDNANLNNSFTKDVDNEMHSKDVIELPFQSLPHANYTIKNYSIKNRPRFMPKGMSQIFENCNTKGVCDYNLDKEYYKCTIYEDFTNNVEINTEIFKSRIQNATENTTKAIEKVQTKLHKENSSLTFDGQLLKQAQVLGQVDGKFIAAVVKDNTQNTKFLVLFDQHAVHERIRLENNLAEYFNQHEWKSVKLDDFLLKLSEDEVLYLHNYKEKFTQLGLEWNILNNCEVSVFGIPEAILGKNSRQVDRIMTAVKNLILEEINAIKSQGGCISLHPKSIMDLVFSEACRYAIKFGDKLTLMDCRELIKSLSECKTPFQCAHGRPAMAVLMEMSRHDIQEYKADISKIRLFSESKRRQELKNIS